MRREVDQGLANEEEGQEGEEQRGWGSEKERKWCSRGKEGKAEDTEGEGPEGWSQCTGTGKGTGGAEGRSLRLCERTVISVA